MALSNKDLRKRLTSMSTQPAKETGEFLANGDHREAIENEMSELDRQLEEGAISRQEYLARLDQIEKNIAAQESFDAHRATSTTWARLPIGGLGCGIVGTLLALLASRLGGGFLFVTLMALALLASLGGAAVVAAPSEKLAARMGLAAPRPTSLVFGFGSGGLLVMLGALALFWGDARFVLSIGFFALFEALRNALGFAMLFVGQNPLFAKALVERDVKQYKAGMAARKQTPKADVIDRLRARKSLVVAASLHALAGAALGAIAPLALLWAVPQIARHHLATNSPAALKQVNASELGFSNPAAAQAAASALQLRAKQALAAAEASGHTASPDWIDNQVLRAGLPAGVGNQYATAPSGAFMLTHDNSLIALSAQPVFLDGQWTPAGFYIAQARANDYIVANTYAPGGMWFVPFYRDADCKHMATDSAGIDREWEAFMSKDTLEQHPLPREGVGCVGEPIAVRATQPLVWPHGVPKGMRGLGLMEAPLASALNVANLTDSPIAAAPGARGKVDGFIESRVRRFFEGTLPHYMPSVVDKS